MAKILLGIGLVASLLIAPPMVGAQSKGSRGPSPNRFIFLLPDDFEGWVCVDFGVVGAPSLPREKDALIIRPRQGEVLATSDKADSYGLYEEAWFEVNGQRKPLPKDVTLQGGVSRTGSAEPSERQCVFVGTTDEKDAASEPPGFERLSTKAGTVIPAEERQALEALYRSTDGEHWKHRVGWLGPPETECNWHGVLCGPSEDQSMRIIALNLRENNLVGAIPEEIGQLRRLDLLNLEKNHLSGAIPNSLGQLRELKRLTLYENHLSGILPGPLIQRWLAGRLDISAETSLLTDVSEIDFESRASALLCSMNRIILRPNGGIVAYNERCRNATPRDRITFCEVKVGRVGEFGMLAWLIEKSGFFDLNPRYDGNMTDATFEDMRVTKGGKLYAVSEYAGAGPFELWTIHRAIEGVAASAHWEKTTTKRKCPDVSQVGPTEMN